MYFVYILKCADDTLYVGCTNDLSRRLHHHNHDKKGARYTRGRRPVELIYSERKRTRRAALQREHQIKSWTRAQKLALVATKEAKQSARVIGR